MSASTPPETPIPHPVPFLECLIVFLLPYFLPVSPNEAAARSEIVDTIASYGGRTRAEIVNAARIIAFSFAALETLAEAKVADLTPAMGLRYKGCANNLNRSCQQNEQNLARRMACDMPDALKEARVPANPVNDMPDPEFHNAVQLAEASIASYRNRLTPTRSSLLPSRNLQAAEQAENNRLWGGAMMTVLAEMGMPVQPVTQAAAMPHQAASAPTTP